MKADGQERPLRILHIGKYFPPHRGGMETFLRDLMAEQQRQGLSVSALVHASDAGLRSVTTNQQEQGQSLRIHRAARWFTLAFAPIAPTFPLLLRRCLREERPDILHLHMPNLSAFWCLFLPAARRVAWVVHWHADVLASTRSAALRWLYWLYRPLEEAVLRRAARIVATSPPYLASSEPLAAHREKCEVVPLGVVDLPDRSVGINGGGIAGDSAPPIPSTELAGQSGSLHLLCVGRLTYYKGVRYLIKAVTELEAVALVVVGNGDEERELVALAERLGADERIRFAGELSDEALLDEIARCDCLCLPSVERTEAFGVVLLEAMRAGKAVIATTVPGSGMGWVVENGITGLLVEAESAPALTSALAKLRDDATLRGKMGSAARARFEQRFRIDQTAGALRVIYEAVIGEN